MHDTGVPDTTGRDNPGAHHYRGKSGQRASSRLDRYDARQTRPTPRMSFPELERYKVIAIKTRLAPAGRRHPHRARPCADFALGQVCAPDTADQGAAPLSADSALQYRSMLVITAHLESRMALAVTRPSATRFTQAFCCA
jgi:hypothetical protein